VRRASRSSSAVGDAPPEAGQIAGARQPARLNVVVERLEHRRLKVAAQVELATRE
jgi:hypothetical protein